MDDNGSVAIAPDDSTVIADPLPQGNTQAQSTPQPAYSPSDVVADPLPPPDDYLSKTEDFIHNVAVGAGKGFHQVAATVGRGAQKLGIPVNKEALEQDDTPHGVGEGVGYGLENIAEFITGDEALKGLSLGDKILQSGKIAKAIEESPRAKKALEIGMKAIRQGTVVGGQTLAKGGTTSQALGAGAGGAVISGAFEGLQALRGAGNTVTEAVTSGAPRAEAGEAQQAAASRIRETHGAAVGAAKEVAMPDGFALKLGPDTELGKSLNGLSESLGSAEGLESLKDPEVARAKAVIDELNPKDGSAVDRAKVQAIKNQLNSTIDQQQKSVAAGTANGQALGYYKQVKKAFDEEVYRQVTPPEAAENLRAANAQYAETVQRQTKGPAGKLFRAKTPEQVIKLLNGPTMDGTTVSEFLQDKTADEVQKLRDGAMRDLVEKNTSRGKTDYVKTLTQFEAQRDAAKTLYGPAYDDLHDSLTHMARVQEVKEAAGRFISRMAKYGTQYIIFRTLLRDVERGGGYGH